MGREALWQKEQTGHCHTPGVQVGPRLMSCNSWMSHILPGLGFFLICIHIMGLPVASAVLPNLYILQTVIPSYTFVLRLY